MLIEKIATPIEGCFELRPQVARDSRGAFIKMFHRESFERLGLRTDWAEQYYSISRQGVLRGLHFQLPPHDHAKLVYCTDGEVMDVAIDLRIGSPTFAKHVCLTLSSATANAAYLGPGLAHGFYTLGASATLVYNVTSVHVPTHDSGIRWDTAGISWPDANPRVSERDRNLVALADFNSPFRFEPALDVARR